MKCTQHTAGVGTIQLRQPERKGPRGLHYVRCFLDNGVASPGFRVRQGVDLNPGFATYFVIQIKSFPLGVFSLVTWGFHLPKFSYGLKLHRGAANEACILGDSTGDRILNKSRGILFQALISPRPKSAPAKRRLPREGSSLGRISF